MTGRKLGLRKRLLALQVTVFGVLLLASPITYLLMSRSLHRQRDAYLESLARYMVADWLRGGGTRRPGIDGSPQPCLADPLIPGSQTIRATHRPRHLLVWDGHHTPLCSDGEAWPLAADEASTALATVQPVFSDVRWAAEVMRLVAWPFRDTNGEILVMEIGTSFMVIEDVLRQGVVLTVVVEAAMLALLIGGSWFLTHRAYIPIDQIIGRVEGIGEDNLAERLPPEETDDQAGRLVAVLNHMLERLQLAFDAQSRFSSDVAHEIRSPLTALRGQIEVALRRERSAEEYRQALSDCLGEVLRLARLAEDLMSLARAEAGTLQVRHQAVELRETLRELLRRGRDRAREKDIALRLTANDPVWVRGDRELLGRLVENLIDNALIHSKRMDEVVVELRRTADRAEVTVTDHGLGIPKEHLERIFDRFYRVDPARSRDAGGTGLGLAIARQIAALHDGIVTVASEVGRGSTFTVTIPAEPTPGAPG